MYVLKLHGFLNFNLFELRNLISLEEHIKRRNTLLMLVHWGRKGSWLKWEYFIMVCPTPCFQSWVGLVGKLRNSVANGHSFSSVKAEFSALFPFNIWCCICLEILSINVLLWMIVWNSNTITILFSMFWLHKISPVEMVLFMEGCKSFIFFSWRFLTIACCLWGVLEPFIHLLLGLEYHF